MIPIRRAPIQARLRLRNVAIPANLDTASEHGRERPVEGRAIPGHWEGSLLSGAKNRYMATLLERHSRFAVRIEVATDVQLYFCDPQSPWQRATKENTNRLLRQYFPRRTDLSIHSQAPLALRLNQCPRKQYGRNLSSDRAYAAGDQNRSCSFRWAAKEEKVQPF